MRVAIPVIVAVAGVVALGLVLQDRTNSGWKPTRVGVNGAKPWEPDADGRSHLAPATVDCNSAPSNSLEVQRAGARHSEREHPAASYVERAYGGGLAALGLTPDQQKKTIELLARWRASNRDAFELTSRMDERKKLMEINRLHLAQDLQPLLPRALVAKIDMMLVAGLSWGDVWDNHRPYLEKNGCAMTIDQALAMATVLAKLNSRPDIIELRRTVDPVEGVTKMNSLILQQLAGILDERQLVLLKKPMERDAQFRETDTN